MAMIRCFCGFVQQLLGTPPLPLVERTRQPAALIPVADPPHRLRGQMHHLGHRRRASSLPTTAPGQGPAGPLAPAECRLAKVAEAASDLRQIHAPQGGVATCPSIGPKIPQKQYIIESFHAVKDLVRGDPEELQAAFRPYVQRLKMGDTLRAREAVVAITKLAPPFLEDLIVSLARNSDEE